LCLLLGIAACGGSALGASDGPALFKQHCALCHGKDGKANTPAAKDLSASSLWPFDGSNTAAHFTATPPCSPPM
jgi:mono/diheme cytochrome c family protein